MHVVSMSDVELDLLEKGRQQDSDWVLERLELLPLLSEYGEVRVVGAKGLGVMVAKDIDISVVVDEVKVTRWQDLVQRLMVRPYVRNVSAIDYYHYDENNRYDLANGQKYSLYVAINNIVGPESDKFDTWECQIHLIDVIKFDESLFEGVMAKLTAEKRLVILRLKYWANLVNKRLLQATNGNFKIYSPKIYEAVLDKGISEAEDFKQYYRQTVPERFKQVYGRIVAANLS